MRIPPALPGVALALAVAATAPGATGIQDGAGEQGFESLFDGATLAGWSGDPRFWSVRDGAIVGESTAATPCVHTTYLTLADRTVVDFDLRLEFKIEVGNSGIQVRSEPVGTWDLRGYQADLEGGGGITGTLYEQYGRGLLAARGQHVEVAPPGEARVEELVEAGDAAATDTPLHGGEWTSYRILARGPRLELFVDGRPTCVVVDRHRRYARRAGLVGLQLHAGPPMRVAFRNLRMRDLGGDPDAGPRLVNPVPPQWLWSGPEPAAGEEVWLKRDFEVAGELAEATLRGTGDDRMEVYLNGELVVVAEDPERFVVQDVRAHVRPGTNALAVWARNDADHAGVWLELRMVAADGSKSRLFTDTRWMARGDEPAEWNRPGFAEEGWKPAFAFGPLGKQPFARAIGRTDGTPATALDGEQIEAPAGFRVELVYSVPRARQGSWVSLTADDRGRLYAGDQGGAIYRIAPGEADARVERIDLDVGEAQGLLWAHDALYVIVNSSTRSSGLYRLRDSDGDDRLDAVEVLTELDGEGEHGPHAVVAGPDGRSLWVLGGNHADVPHRLTRLAARPVRADDSLLPQLPDPNGHKPGVTASGGWLARTDPEGKAWELWCVGLRNPYDLAFDRHGEAFTVDADMEWDRGLPWYRPTRLLHLVSGADFGWRHGSAKWPADLPDTLPPALDLGPGSPTGLVAGTELAFPAAYRRGIFVADWAFGSVRVLSPRPRGASYTASVEPFLHGRPLPVCDLAAGADGALYFVTGGRSLQSGLYRVSWNGAVDDQDAPGALEEPDEPGEPEAEDPAAASARALRRSLEAFHGRADPAALDRAWPHLASDDPAIRNAARVAVESQPVERWAERALAEERPRAAVQAWIALARTADPSLRAPLLAALGRAPWDELDVDARLEHLRALDRVLVHLGTPADDAPLLARLESRYPSGDARVDEELCALLVRLGSEVVVARTMPRLAGPVRRGQIRSAFLLRLARAGWTPQARRAYFAWLARAPFELEGGHSFRQYLLALRDEALDGLEPEERAGLGELARPLSADDFSAGTSRPFVRTWTLGALLPKLGRLEDEERDLERGAELYREASCLQCHRLGDEGGRDGPDLTRAAARFSPRDLVEAILWPSRTISDQYRDTEVWMLDDGVHVGTILREDAETLTVLVRDPTEQILTLPRDEVEMRRPTSVSKMPEGLFDTMELEEILDLLAYVLAERE